MDQWIVGLMDHCAGLPDFEKSVWICEIRGQKISGIGKL